MSTVIIQQDCYERIREVFDAAPFTYSVVPVSQPEEMVRAQSDTGAQVFIIGAEPYPRSFYESIAEGSLVIRYGVGYDRVPIDLCKERGVAVGYTPGTLDQSVAEHTVALMLACVRSIPQQDQSVRNGEWLHTSGAEMEGKTAAILGFGQIGRRVAGILKAAFNMQIVAYDVFDEPDSEAASLLDRYTTEYETAVKEADFVSLHMKVTDETKKFVNRGRLRAMKSSAYLINTARGALIHEIDLYHALADGDIGGAALDVFSEEPYVPAGPDTDLRRLSNAILTAHAGSNTYEANRKMAEICINGAEAWYRGDRDGLVLVPEMSG